MRYITATQVHHNHAAKGGGVANCHSSTLTIYDCSATVSGSGTFNCDNAMLRLFNCQASQGNGVFVGDNHNLTVSGNLGIGASNPAAKLDVSGDTHVSGKLGIGTTTPTARFDVNGTAHITSRLTVDSNVGIGVSNPLARLHVSGNTYISSGNVGIGASDPGAKLDVRGNTHISGSVGIGTISPDQKLQVAGNAVIGSSGKELEIGSFGSSADLAGLAHKDSNQYALAQKPSGQTFVNSANGKSLHLRQSNSDRVVIAASGNVGIGTASPEGKLQIIDANQDANGGTLALGPKGQSNLRLGYDTNYSWVQSHGGKPLAINPIANNVGIGTTNPSHKLEVNGTIDSKGLRFDNNVSSHINADGALYRFASQCYLTVDDNFYIRDTANKGEFRFHTNDNAFFQMTVHDNQFTMSMNSSGLFFNLDRSHHGGSGDRKILWNGDGNWDLQSDRKLKTNIKTVKGILKRLVQLDVKNYQWKDAQGKDPVKIGFIAQDVQPLFPELVGSMTDPDTNKTSLTLKYADLGAVAIGGLKELKAEMETTIAEQNKLIAKQNKLIEALQKRIETLEKSVEKVKF